MDTVLLIVLSIIATGGVGYSYILSRSRKDLEKKQQGPQFTDISEEEAIKRASLKAQNIILESEREADKIKSEATKLATDQRQTIIEEEKRLDDREKKLVDRAKLLDERFESLENKEKTLEQSKKDVRKRGEKINEELQKLAQLSHEEAKKIILEKTEAELKSFIARKIREAEFEIESTSEQKSREILIDVMQKSATDYVAE